jgi:DsbC/DsbD-like thiol-disulfide interchange protein
MNPVVVSAMVADRPGGKDLVIRIKMLAGWHIYGYVSEQDPYIPTTFDIELPEGWQKDGDMQLPRFRTEPTGTTLYEGDVVLRQPLKGSGHGTLRLTVNYQTCDDHACLPPRDVVFTLEI